MIGDLAGWCQIDDGQLGAAEETQPRPRCAFHAGAARHQKLAPARQVRQAGSPAPRYPRQRHYRADHGQSDLAPVRVARYQQSAGTLPKAKFGPCPSTKWKCSGSAATCVLVSKDASSERHVRLSPPPRSNDSVAETVVNSGPGRCSPSRGLPCPPVRRRPAREPPDLLHATGPFSSTTNLPPVVAGSA